MQDLVFWILAGISLISLICAIIFACACRRRPKEMSCELLSVSEVAIFPEAAADVEQDIKNMELTVVQPLRQPEVFPADFLQITQPTSPGRAEVYAEGAATKTLPPKPRKKSDMDVINELLEKLK